MLLGEFAARLTEEINNGDLVLARTEVEPVVHLLDGRTMYLLSNGELSYEDDEGYEDDVDETLYDPYMGCDVVECADLSDEW